jgi:hypothetical protein
MVKFNLLPPLKNKSRQKGYGSITSLALANEDPESAVENADSYRIFCEAAKSSTACGALGDCRIFGMGGHPAGKLSVNESTSSLGESIDESLRAR